MIFFKKKKFVFPVLKKKSFIPAIFGKRTNEKFDRLVERFGYPEHASINGKAQINTWGTAVFPSGNQFVVDAKTGDIIEKTEKVRYIGASKGLHFYIHEDNDLLIGDSAKASFPSGGKNDA